MATGHLIRNAAGRQDLHLYVDGTRADRSLTYTGSAQWADASVFWSGIVEAGDHDVWLQGVGANVWGCEGEWGDLDIVVMPSGIEGLEVHQTPDQRSGCPPSAAAGARLIEHAFTVQQDSLLLVTGHIIRNAAGRQDLHLLLTAGWRTGR